MDMDGFGGRWLSTEVASCGGGGNVGSHGDGNNQEQKRDPGFV